MRELIRVKEITTQELIDKRNKSPQINIIDVREDEEVAKSIIPGAKHIPMGQIPDRLNEIDKNETYYLICRSGGRSRKAGLFMNEQGFDTVNVDGGMLEWGEETEKRS